MRLLHLPGEPFVDYQLFAQQQNSSGYIPLEKSFAEGGYEPNWAFAAPQSEQQMKAVIAELLKSQP